MYGGGKVVPKNKIPGIAESDRGPIPEVNLVLRVFYYVHLLGIFAWTNFPEESPVL